MGFSFKLKLPQTYVNIIKDIYNKNKSRVKLYRTGHTIKVGRGLRKGDPLSPKLFTNVLHHIMSSIDCYCKGIIIGGKHFSHLRFSNDIILESESANQLVEMLNDLYIVSSNVDLEMNSLKTKILTNSTKKKELTTKQYTT